MGIWSRMLTTSVLQFSFYQCLCTCGILFITWTPALGIFIRFVIHISYLTQKNKILDERTLEKLWMI